MDNRNPVTLKCHYCNETIYEGEEYRLADEYGPTAHQSCDEKEDRKLAEENREYLKRIEAKEARGEELTFEELLATIADAYHQALRNQLFRDIFPKKESQ